MLRYNKAKQGARIFQEMHESGVTELWLERFGWRYFQSDIKRLKKYKFGPQSFKALPLRSDIKIVFFLELIALGISFVVCLGEIGWSAVTRGKWGGTRVRKFDGRVAQKRRLQQWVIMATQFPKRFIRKNYRWLGVIIFRKIRKIITDRI